VNAPPAPRLLGWAWLSIGAAVSTIALKASAYLLTGSVGLLSDALESVVNLVAAVLALVALTIAARPADDSHHFGHGKVEYFSAGAEGLMILVAAALIIVSAVERLVNPRPLEDLGIGLAITIVATVINGVVGWLVLRAGRRHRSATLVADGKHLLTDVWTSIGVVVGVGLVAVTGWVPLDSLVAIAVALNILWTGWGLVRHSMNGLMDHALPADEVAKVSTALRTVSRTHASGEVEFHAIQTREAGRERYVSMHVLVPGTWTVAQGHDLLEQVEDEICAVLPGAQVHTHLEPREDPRSYGDSRGGFAVGPDPA
jgi:cation diffusion facilitator family transporter